MKKMMQWMLALILISGTSVFISCSLKKNTQAMDPDSEKSEAVDYSKMTFISLILQFFNKNIWK